MEKHNKYKIDFLDRKDYDFTGIGLTSCIIIDEALKRGIKAKYILNKYIQMEYNGKIELFHKSDNMSMSSITKQIVCSKTETKHFLKKENILVPEGKRFNAEQIDEIIAYAKHLNGRIVIKPDNTDYGISVYCRAERRKIKEIVDTIAKKYKKIVVEKFIEGNEYRIFVTKNGSLAVTMRRLPSVLGDGKNSIRQLIEQKNKNRQKKTNGFRTLPWIKIIIDDIALSCLKKQKLTLDSVPEQNKRVFLRFSSNVSYGGDPIAVTDIAHESVRKIAMKVLDSIPGLTYAGIDLISKDITKDISNRYRIIEVNNMPGLLVHHYPYIGKPKNVASALIDLVFPETKSS